MFPSHLCDNKTKCINVTQFCDDVKDCNDGSDEGGMCGKCGFFKVLINKNLKTIGSI